MTEDLERWLGELPVLRRVVPVAREVGVGGGRMVVTSVEVWGDRVYWHLTRFPPPDGPDDAPPYRMDDDCGTAYAVVGTGGLGDGRWWSEFATFRPAPPAGARELVLGGGPIRPGDEVRVALQD